MSRGTSRLERDMSSAKTRETVVGPGEEGSAPEAHDEPPTNGTRKGKGGRETELEIYLTNLEILLAERIESPTTVVWDRSRGPRTRDRGLNTGQ